MSASDHVNPDQLKLFMTARELREQYWPNFEDIQHADRHVGTGSDDDVVNSVWDRKLKESKESGLYEDIKDLGVRIPVTVEDNPWPGAPSKPQVYGGHHRIAAAYDINPDMLIPVNYDEDIEDAWEVDHERTVADPVLQKHVQKKYGGFGNPKTYKRTTGW